MNGSPARRIVVLIGSTTAAVLAVAVAVLVSAWALVVVPFALVVGVCAYKGLTLSQTWDALVIASGDDAGRGPAGMTL